MRTSLFALGFLVLGLAQCSGDRGLFVGDERDPGAGEGGEGNETGGSGGTENRGGNESSGGTESRGGSGSGAEAGEPATGGTESRGGSGSGAEAGEPGTGGTGTAARGGTEAGGSAGEGGATRGGAAGSGAEAGSGTAARGGTNDGGRSGSSNAGEGGASTTDCNALAREYIERLALAQQCSPILTVEQCTIEMPDDFFCPCPTYVNPAREGDIRRLNQILESARRCARVCPAIACPAVKRGTCSADAIVAADGRCVGVL